MHPLDSWLRTLKYTYTHIDRHAQASLEQRRTTSATMPRALAAWTGPWREASANFCVR